MYKKRFRENFLTKYCISSSRPAMTVQALTFSQKLTKFLETEHKILKIQMRLEF